MSGRRRSRPIGKGLIKLTTPVRKPFLGKMIELGKFPVYLYESHTTPACRCFGRLLFWFLRRGLGMNVENADLGIQKGDRVGELWVTQGT